MVKTFREALLARVEATETSLRAVADATGVSYEQLKKIGQRDTASTNVDDALKIAAYFGLTVNEMVGDDLAEDRARLATLYSQLSDTERRILRAAADVQRAQGLTAGAQ